MVRSASILVLFLVAPAFAQELTRERAEKADALCKEGVTLFDQRNFPDAEKIFAEARDLNPFDVRPPFYLAQCQYNYWKEDGDESRKERILGYLAEAEKIDPRFGGSYFLLGVFAVSLKDYRLAADAFDAALDRSFNVTASRANLALCLYFWGVSLAESAGAAHEQVIKVLDDARERLEALKDNLSYPTAERQQFRELWVGSLVNLVAMHQRASNYELARKTVQRLIELEPENPLHPYNLGLIEGGTQKWEAALAAYKRALDLNKDPDWVDPYLRTACIHSLRDENDLAERDFAKFIEKRPDQWEGLFRYAEHCLRLQKFDAAATAFKKSLELDPNEINAMYKLGQALTYMKQKDEASKWMSLYAGLDALKRQRELEQSIRDGRPPLDGSHVPSEYGPKPPGGGGTGGGK